MSPRGFPGRPIRISGSDISFSRSDSVSGHSKKHLTVSDLNVSPLTLTCGRPHEFDPGARSRFVYNSYTSWHRLCAKKDTGLPHRPSEPSKSTFIDPNPRNTTVKKKVFSLFP